MSLLGERSVGSRRCRVAEIERPRGPLCAATQIVEIKTFTLRERYEVLLLRTSCYAAVARRTQNFVPKAFYLSLSVINRVETLALCVSALAFIFQYGRSYRGARQIIAQQVSCEWYRWFLRKSLLVTSSFLETYLFSLLTISTHNHSGKKYKTIYILIFWKISKYLISSNDMTQKYLSCCLVGSS